MDIDVDSYIRFLLSLLLVVGLILLLAAGLRRWGGRLGLPGAAAGRDRRLQVVESTAVDPRRRLVLVRCDDTEHLLLVGGLNDVVVDRDIQTPRSSVPLASVPLSSVPLSSVPSSSISRSSAEERETSTAAPGSFRAILGRQRTGPAGQESVAGHETRQ